MGVEDNGGASSAERVLPRILRRTAFQFCSLPDTGWFGLTPLRTHILICGCPRSGSTMLQLMMEAALPHARKFKKEIRGWRAATSRLRNHAVMLTKRPRDILELDRVKNLYATRSAKLRTIVTIRDPRDALTSPHPRSVGLRPYHISIDAWRELYPGIRQHMNDPEVLVMRYEDLVGDPKKAEAMIQAFVEEPFQRSFADFHQTVRAGFDTRALNGVRPVDGRGVGRWRQRQYAERIEEILREIPDFPQHLTTLGYEPAGWLQAGAA